MCDFQIEDILFSVCVCVSSVIYYFRFCESLFMDWVYYVEIRLTSYVQRINQVTETFHSHWKVRTAS